MKTKILIGNGNNNYTLSPAISNKVLDTNFIIKGAVKLLSTTDGQWAFQMTGDVTNRHYFTKKHYTLSKA